MSDLRKRLEIEAALTKEMAVIEGSLNALEHASYNGITAVVKMLRVELENLQAIDAARATNSASADRAKGE